MGVSVLFPGVPYPEDSFRRRESSGKTVTGFDRQRSDSTNTVGDKGIYDRIFPAGNVGFLLKGNYLRTATNIRSKLTIASSSGRMKSMPSAPSSSGNCIESTGRVLTAMFPIVQTVFSIFSRNSGSV